MSEIIGIIGAMEEEVQSLIASMPDAAQETCAGMTFYSGRLGAQNAVVVRSGVGKVHAALCVQILNDRYQVGRILNTGVAGSLDPQINIGDIVISSDAVQHDVNATLFGYAPGEIPQLGVLAFQADEMLQKEVEAAVKEAAPDIGCFTGRIASGDQFIADLQQKETIRTTFHALCCEMEGAAVAQAAFCNGIPFCIVRAISDKADGSDVVDYPVFEKKAAADSAAIVRHMLSKKGAAHGTL